MEPVRSERDLRDKIDIIKSAVETRADIGTYLNQLVNVLAQQQISSGGLDKLLTENEDKTKALQTSLKSYTDEKNNALRTAKNPQLQIPQDVHNETAKMDLSDVKVMIPMDDSLRQRLTILFSETSMRGFSHRQMRGALRIALHKEERDFLNQVAHVENLQDVVDHLINAFERPNEMVEDKEKQLMHFHRKANETFGMAFCRLSILLQSIAPSLPLLQLQGSKSAILYEACNRLISPSCGIEVKSKVKKFTRVNKFPSTEQLRDIIEDVEQDLKHVPRGPLSLYPDQKEMVAMPGLRSSQGADDRRRERRERSISRERSSRSSAFDRNRSIPPQAPENTPLPMDQDDKAEADLHTPSPAAAHNNRMQSRSPSRERVSHRNGSTDRFRQSRAQRSYSPMSHGSTNQIYPKQQNPPMSKQQETSSGRNYERRRSWSRNRTPERYNQSARYRSPTPGPQYRRQSRSPGPRRNRSYSGNRRSRSPAQVVIDVRTSSEIPDGRYRVVCNSCDKLKQNCTCQGN